MIRYRDVEVAPVPVKEPKERKPRELKYPMDDIAIGGARVFPLEGKTAKNAYAAVFQAASKYRKANPDFRFKVIVHQDKDEVWVHRLAVEEK